MNHDLTSGKPSVVLWRFCLPLFASVIFQQLYNIADSLVAGRFIGEAALAAVGNSYEITLIFIAFAFGCNIGCSVVVSQLFGAGDMPRMRQAVTTAMISCAVLCGALMLMGLLAGDTFLRWINTPAGIFADSSLYLRIYVLGLPFMFFYNLSTGIFSALGDSATPFRFLAVSSVVNIAIDILFVAVFRMGIAGVAWATFLCQGASCILAVLFVLKRLRGLLPAEDRLPLFSAEMLRRLCRIAIPSILQQSSISIGNIILQGVINGFGEAVVAGYSASIKLNNLVVTSFTTMGNGISTFTGQNTGANRPDRIRSGFFAGLRMVLMICLPMTLLYVFGSGALVRLFMSEPSALALKTGKQILYVLAPAYPLVATKLISDGILRGSGHMNAFMFGTFTDLILRVVLAILLSSQMGTMGIWIAWPIGWGIAMLISLFFSNRLYGLFRHG